MTGRVLSEEQLAEVVKRQNKWDEEPFGVYPDKNNPAFIQERLEMSWLASKVPDLIATIRDSQQREQKLAKKVLESAEIIHELRSNVIAYVKKIGDIGLESAYMHEALDRIDDLDYRYPEEYTVEARRITEDVLAKLEDLPRERTTDNA